MNRKLQLQQHESLANGSTTKIRCFLVFLTFVFALIAFLAPKPHSDQKVEIEMFTSPPIPYLLIITVTCLIPFAWVFTNDKMMRYDDDDYKRYYLIKYFV